MRRIVPLAVLLVAGALVGSRPAPPAAGEIRAPAAQLGRDEFADREPATRHLQELGEVAITELRAGCKSENPEIARRSQDILRRIERRLANEKTLAPTLVELDAKDQPLDDVLADLSKQAKCDIVLNGPKLKDLAAKKMTLSTGRAVPFWEAVLKVCDVAEVEIASVSGFHSPGAMPLHLGQSQAGVRSCKGHEPRGRPGGPRGREARPGGGHLGPCWSRSYPSPRVRSRPSRRSSYRRGRNRDSSGRRPAP